MTSFSTSVWAFLALIGAVSVFSMLLAMASSVRNQVQIHEVRQKVARLRRKYAAEQGGRQADETIEVDVIEDDPAAPELAKAA